ncbi:hypothetical protein [Oricola cellulosilytica]|uniref:Lipoprotein n=1 Tax=Oricola cellulosilytica TaxID=1429082 RepID=A0A4R0PGE3_9HYPH|nr:hypothetical protein [Oricola cellulosilytica]TCD16148.1 hypothetical protein E0D97_01540 [Oricola cellulosilytica]
MHSIATPKLTASMLALALLLAGCATSPDFGETLETRSEQASAIAGDYKKGEKLIEAGRKDVREGRKLARKGENRVNRGEDRIREGEAMMAAARAAYCRDTGYATPECR